MSESGIQAPQNTPDNGTSRNNSPTPTEIDLESSWFGNVREGRNSEEVVDIADEYVKIRLIKTESLGDQLPESESDDMLVLTGKEAQEARDNAGPWVNGLPVQVIFFGGTRKVKKVQSWNGTVIPRKML